MELNTLINKCNKPDSIELLDNKISFNRHFAKYVKRDWLSSEGMTFEQFKVFCKNKEAIIKPLNECEGKGIELIELPDSKNEDAIRKLFDSFKSRGLIIEVRIHNHPDMNFNNHSINTIRINSLTDLNGNTHLFKPVLRAGVGESFVDNYNAGGCEYAIDVESGVIISERYQGYKLNGIYHPGSHIIMPGYRIPLWEDIIKTVKDACRLIPGCRFVGWDVAITPEGIQLIEGNHNPGNVGIEYFGERGWWEKLKKFI